MPRTAVVTFILLASLLVTGSVQAQVDLKPRTVASPSPGLSQVRPCTSLS